MFPVASVAGAAQQCVRHLYRKMNRGQSTVIAYIGQNCDLSRFVSGARGSVGLCRGKSMGAECLKYAFVFVFFLSP